MTSPKQLKYWRKNVKIIYWHLFGFYLQFLFRSIKPKIQKYLVAIYFISRSRVIYLSNYYNSLMSVCQFLAPLPESD